MKKIIIWTIVVVFVLLQFYRPEKNTASASSANAIELHYNVPQNVGKLLKASCYDCHSNNTQYPWYSNVQPVGLWLSNHITDGKKHLNFDEFNSYPSNKKKKKMHEVAELVENEEMPLYSYTLVHTNAKLSDADKKLLINWANELSNSF